MSFPNFDRWKHLRTNLFNNVEIQVSLRGTTFMFDTEEQLMNALSGKHEAHIHPDRLPGYLARKCYDSEPTPEGDVKLTRNLITKKPKPHTVPSEFMTWIFEIDGISKSALTQLDRHRMASFLQQSGRWMDRSETRFVYDSYYEIDDEKTVIEWYKEDAAEVERCLKEYKQRRGRTHTNAKGETVAMSRQSARRKLTLDFATGTFLAINTLSLRNALELRLDTHAEWEIRRAAKLMWDKVMKVAPAQMNALVLPEGL
ncbi:MAG: FAD-dependent thymidylate synthase [Fibrobacteres bacterium]|nr:FAD-dependent thymidylate synthase [Fibrobacterota bacterium]